MLNATTLINSGCGMYQQVYSNFPEVFVASQPAPAATAGYALEDNLGAVGASAGEASGQTVQSCASTCNIDPSCRGFVFEKTANAMCYFKGADIQADRGNASLAMYSKSPMPPVALYVPPKVFAPPAPTGFQVLDNSDATGTALGWYGQQTMVTCTQKCSVSVNCGGFVLEKFPGTVCVLFGADIAAQPGQGNYAVYAKNVMIRS
jgi:hypothetical protein